MGKSIFEKNKLQLCKFVTYRTLDLKRRANPTYILYGTTNISGILQNNVLSITYPTYLFLTFYVKASSIMYFRKSLARNIGLFWSIGKLTYSRLASYGLSGLLLLKGEKAVYFPPFFLWNLKMIPYRIGAAALTSLILCYCVSHRFLCFLSVSFYLGLYFLSLFKCGEFVWITLKILTSCS